MLNFWAILCLEKIRNFLICWYLNKTCKFYILKNIKAFFYFWMKTTSSKSKKNSYFEYGNSFQCKNSVLRDVTYHPTPSLLNERLNPPSLFLILCSRIKMFFTWHGSQHSCFFFNCSVGISLNLPYLGLSRIRPLDKS